MNRPAPAIGLRLGHRVQDGSPFLHGIAGKDLEIPAGSRVQLRRVAPDGPDQATHVIVFAPPLAGISDTKQSLERARADSLWSRADHASSATGQTPNPMTDDR